MNIHIKTYAQEFMSSDNASHSIYKTIENLEKCRGISKLVSRNGYIINYIFIDGSIVQTTVDHNRIGALILEGDL